MADTDFDAVAGSLNNKINRYSSSEIECGTWVDGKTLYRKVITFTTGSTNITICGFTFTERIGFRMEVRKCKYCKKAAADEFSDFCSGECLSAWMEGRKKRVCTECGKEFYTQRGRSDKRCERCIYRAKWSSRPDRPQYVPPAPDGIDRVIEEQKAEFAKTGRRLSYGEIMAAKLKE